MTFTENTPSFATISIVPLYRFTVEETDGMPNPWPGSRVTGRCSLLNRTFPVYGLSMVSPSIVSDNMLEKTTIRRFSSATFAVAWTAFSSRLPRSAQ